MILHFHQPWECHLSQKQRTTIKKLDSWDLDSVLYQTWVIYPGYVPFLHTAAQFYKNCFESLYHWQIKGQPKHITDLAGKHPVDGWFIWAVFLSVCDVCGHLHEVFCDLWPLPEGRYSWHWHCCCPWCPTRLRTQGTELRIAAVGVSYTWLSFPGI